MERALCLSLQGAKEPAPAAAPTGPACCIINTSCKIWPLWFILEVTACSNKLLFNSTIQRCNLRDEFQLLSMVSLSFLTWTGLIRSIDQGRLRAQYRAQIHCPKVTSYPLPAWEYVRDGPGYSGALDCPKHFSMPPLTNHFIISSFCCTIVLRKTEIVEIFSPS